MPTYFTSDLHFGHTNILKWRKDEHGDPLFGSLDEMHDTLITNWNDTVGPDDIVYVLGDICMGQRDQTLPLVSELNGMKVLFPGNHDHIHAMHITGKGLPWASKWLDAYAKVVLFAPECRVESIKGLGTVGLCHFPFDGDHTDEQRYDEWRPVHLLDPNNSGVGAGGVNVLLHGHVHGLWKRRDFHSQAHTCTPQINVGVDVWNYAPVSVEQIQEVLQ